MQTINQIRKVKFIVDWNDFHRGMQYPVGQVGKETAEQLEKEGVARIIPVEVVETEPVAGWKTFEVKKPEVKTPGRKPK